MNTKQDVLLIPGKTSPGIHLWGRATKSIRVRHTAHN